jgi:hypothetical protein
MKTSKSFQISNCIEERSSISFGAVFLSVLITLSTLSTLLLSV